MRRKSGISVTVPSQFSGSFYATLSLSKRVLITVPNSLSAIQCGLDLSSNKECHYHNDTMKISGLNCGRGMWRKGGSHSLEETGVLTPYARYLPHPASDKVQCTGNRLCLTVSIIR